MSDKYSEHLIAVLTKTGKNYDLEKITRAYEYARELHAGQFRKDGSEYISHPVAVAEIVAGLGLDTDSVCAALLHDTVEDCPEKVDIEMIRKEFGDSVVELVEGLTKLIRIPFESQEEQHMENLRKMFLAMAKDIRVIFIKLCDRLHNMRTLNAKPEERRRVIALETMNVYAPLAHRLGMQRIKQELENLSLQYLDPIGYEEVMRHISQKYGQSKDFLKAMQPLIQEKMAENGINCTIEGRVKTPYSIYRKMYNQNKGFNEIYDFYALRIIVDTELECYSALGIIHDMYNLMPGRFKDYISTPKPNGYRSLHTTVIGRNGIPFEVQIRTWEMHRIAEYGVAAHWKYKSGDTASTDVMNNLKWIATLIESEESTNDPDDFLSALKIDIFQDESFVFTPKGDVVSLPQNSTCIDFAYHIHSEVGNHMVGAKVNGTIVPINRVLNNGEIVEILTSSSSKGPSRDWLKIVTTSQAKAKIRQWFKKERRADNIVAGRAEVENELRRTGLVCTDEQFDEIANNVAKRLGIMDAEDLFNTIGYGGLLISKIAPRLKEEYEKTVEPENEVSITDPSQVQTVQRTSSAKEYAGIEVDGLEGCEVKYAKCCNPLPGDSIIGFITKGHGISVHKADCVNVLRAAGSEKDRLVNVAWRKISETTDLSGHFEAIIKIYAKDRISMLADISMALADMRVSILSINTQKQKHEQTSINLVIACRDTTHLFNIISRIKQIPDVYDIVRGSVK